MSRLTDSQIDLARRGVVWLAGSPLPVELTGEERAVARLGESGGPAGQLAFAERPFGTLRAGGRRKRDALAAIDRWYRREARERIGEVTAAESERLGLYPSKLSIRDQKTRWGSCSTSGTLSFNWRLVIGPGHALRYVVVHELVHLRHHDHSAAFWSSLGEALPDWKRSAAWLRANERLITAYRPAI
jgi:predicted metal-dependent hydrolase